MARKKPLPINPEQIHPGDWVKIVYKPELGCLYSRGHIVQVDDSNYEKRIARINDLDFGPQYLSFDEVRLTLPLVQQLPNKQTEELPNNQTEELPNNQTEELPNNQGGTFAQQLPGDELPNNQTEELPNNQTEELPNNQVDTSARQLSSNGWYERRYVQKSNGNKCGPYLYKVWRENGKRRSKYLGRC
ncbi:MAG: hypothetical protein WAN66_14170 [Limnoraphis robusta]|uniref:Uncharacterized protein n=1 Tax=Limnoraphis robusta CS-951 TaxID=1637645 RepID=A0A0F5YJ52_9CYAN|nr:hypothetical protein [Limnoraphis robusta]KKD38788.1 hypothetical protein WN50_07015 [Limnoraphis robusta CS-951]